MLRDVVRVFHCDDSSSFRVLVREILAGYEDVEIVGEAGSPEEALAGVGAVRPDVVLLDLLPPGPRDSLVAELRVLVPRARVVVYSGYPVTVSRDRHPDACAYLDKAASFTALHQALRAAA
jgi:DNA-binding NarL/FixJ family response regulator